MFVLFIEIVGNCNNNSQKRTTGDDKKGSPSRGGEKENWTRKFPDDDCSSVPAGSRRTSVTPCHRWTWGGYIHFPIIIQIP